MSRKPTSEIFKAWDEIVFQAIPWTTEERIRRWRSLYEQTWQHGQAIGDIDNCWLTITLG